ncbi:MAG: glycoside hydrolase family 3 C-terminal domain-containing protein [Microcella sp.]|uniref:glycoside hydrolase family 3 N-terminal domain-containing protein n=1 Tax=Microcella sp. TaxID=1913979 RepID=UPI0024C9AE4D|nr:glycoside hydrolase family 3 N-terminal domain-containing protein [Microcella sp.]UYN83450.1 MAG: glycoside hydrolase family 3 C-terminal domain-containing protein [Microcella sp.]
MSTAPAERLSSTVRARWHDPSLSPRERAQALLDEMTTAEKIAQLGSHWEDRRDDGAVIAPGQEGFRRVARPTLEQSAARGLGHLTRVFGTEPVPSIDGMAALHDSQLTVIGSNRFGIPAIAHEECLTGVTTLGATVYPAAIAWAATFDPELVERMASAIGDDLRALGVHQALAPVLDVVRDYRWGRVEETLGEDPHVVAELGTAYVRGLESTGIIATLKHFAGHAGSRGGRNHAPVDLGPRQLADIVLPPFESAIRLGGARSVMNSYTDLDGVPSAADPRLLTSILRTEWGFDGTVVSDYWSVPFLGSKHRVAATLRDAAVLALRAGLDVELPYTMGFAELESAVDDGVLDSSLIDRAALRVLTQKAQLGLLDEGWQPAAPALVDLDSPRNRSIAREIAERSIVLLQNREGVLPLADRPQRIALIGPCADDPSSYLGCYSFPIHVLPRHPELEWGIPLRSLPDALRDALPSSTITVARGCELDSLDTSGFAETRDLARSSDVVIVVVGDRAGMFGEGTSGEGSDAPDLRLPGVQQELVLELASTGTPVILLCVSGRPYALGEVDAVSAASIQSFMPGAEGADAIAAVMSGAVVPSGHLPVEIPRTPDALPHTYLAPPLGKDGDRISSISVSPAYPFGHGASYTTFDVTALEVDRDRVAVNASVTATMSVTNTGERDGETVVQLYVDDPVAQVVQPVTRLIGFRRLALTAGETRTVTMAISSDCFSFTGLHGYRIVEPGELHLRAALSSADEGRAVSIELTGGVRAVGPRRTLRPEVTVDDE